MYYLELCDELPEEPKQKLLTKFAYGIWEGGGAESKIVKFYKHSFDFFFLLFSCTTLS